jgi:2-polyprenyl-3-methyl-5-hydroxy-6-metoxy-1,4-benzoquinol methylase
MEDPEETNRLEIKTHPEVIREQAQWCGVKSGLRVLDAGCGPGKTTSILHQMLQPAGSMLGMDYSEERIHYAIEHYGQESGIDFHIHDLRDPIEGVGLFDIVWVRFVLEHNLAETPTIVRNLTNCLNPGGILCLIDLDHNCLNHYGLPPNMEQILFRLMAILEERHNFDPYAGRKLYANLYDLGYEDIEMDLIAHHLFYGKIRDEDIFNWIRKTETASLKMKELFEDYPGGYDDFFADFKKFFLDPRRFTYTPLILCKGRKPLLS